MEAGPFGFRPRPIRVGTASEGVAGRKTTGTAALERLVAAPLAATTAVGAGLGARRLRLARRAAAPRAWALERPWSSAWTQTCDS